MTVRRLSLALALVAMLVPAAAAQAASIWTPISSGTTDTISAVVYQSPTRFWYATSNGHIEYFNGSAFIPGAGVTPGENFTDLAFQPTSVPGGPGSQGLYGYAVTSTGHVWQTHDGGVSWSQLAAPSTRTDCSPGAGSGPESELNAVVWSSASVVYLLGDNSTVERASAANSPTPGFTEINKVGTGNCAVQSQSSTENLTDATFVAANPLNGLIISQDFGTLYATSNGFTSGVDVSPLGTVNNFTGNPRIAQDPAQPNRLWAIDHRVGGSGCGVLCLEFSTDGGVTAAHATFPNDGNPTVGLYDISSQGGAEVTAGSGGEIFNSVDGSNFYLQPAGGALATENWRAEDAFDAAHAAVGGAGGALVVTAQANVIIPPAILPSAGSHPTTTSTGGVKVTAYKTVIVTGRSPRYVPVKVSASLPRTIAVTILTAKGKHRVASGRLTLKHHGRRTIHVRLTGNVKPGKYYVVVRVSTAKGRQVGRRLSIAFKLV